MFRGTYFMPRTSDPTVRYLPPFSNPHETRRRRVSNIAICPPTYLTYIIQPTFSTYLLLSRILPIPYPSIHQYNPTLPIPFLPTIQNHAPPPRNKTPPHNRRHNRLRAQKIPTRRTPTSANTTTTTTTNARKIKCKFLRKRRRRRRVSESES